MPTQYSQSCKSVQTVVTQELLHRAGPRPAGQGPGLSLCPGSCAENRNTLFIPLTQQGHASGPGVPAGSQTYFRRPHHPSFITYSWHQPIRFRKHCKSNIQTSSANVCTHVCVCLYIPFAQAQTPGLLSELGTATQMAPFSQGPQLCPPAFQAQLFLQDGGCPHSARREAVASHAHKAYVLSKRMSLHGGDPKHLSSPMLSGWETTFWTTKAHFNLHN